MERIRGMVTSSGKANAGAAGRGISELSALFKALSDETRLRILMLLGDRELCVCDIVAAMGMSQPKVSFHLGVMKEAGLVRDRRQGRWTHYSIDAQDMFRRLLVLSVLERVPEDAVNEDRRRLKAFLKQKAAKAHGEVQCCGRT